MITMNAHRQYKIIYKSFYSYKTEREVVVRADNATEAMEAFNKLAKWDKIDVDIIISIEPFETPYFYIASYEDGERYAYFFEEKETMYRNVAKAICFSDCSDEVIEYIEDNGHIVRYCGWEPGMKMTFVYNIDDTIAFEGRFPQWDH